MTSEAPPLTVNMCGSFASLVAAPASGGARRLEGRE
jgi:hypothetical protein